MRRGRWRSGGGGAKDGRRRKKGVAIKLFLCVFFLSFALLSFPIRLHVGTGQRVAAKSPESRKIPLLSGNDGSVSKTAAFRLPSIRLRLSANKSGLHVRGARCLSAEDAAPLPLSSDASQHLTGDCAWCLLAALVCFSRFPRDLACWGHLNLHATFPFFFLKRLAAAKCPPDNRQMPSPQRLNRPTLDPSGLFPLANLWL